MNKDIIQIKLTDPLLDAFDNTGKKKNCCQLLFLAIKLTY